MSYSFDEATLSSHAGVDPWKMQRQLKTGDPAAIESLASAFYKASGHLADSTAATKTSQSYVKQGYTVQGSSPLDASAEAAKLVKDPQVGSAHTYQIAKVLGGVGTDLDTAATKATGEVSALDSTISSLVTQYNNLVALYHHTGEDREPDNGLDQAQLEIFNKAVSATKSHGGTVETLLTGYETSLHSALKSMADLGYVPPDGHDEGPGGIDLSAGTSDGKTTVSAAKSGNKAQLQQSTYALSIINDAIKHHGGHVGDDEYGYLYQYYDQTAGHSDVIWNAVKNDSGLKNGAGQTYADGLLNLTRGSEQTDDNGVGPYVRDEHGVGTFGRGGVDGLPSSVQTVLHSDIGKVQPTPQYAGADQSPNMRRAEWVNGHWVVDNYDNDTGFSQLLTLGSQGTQGGTGFSTTLAEAGIRWKHDVNAVQTNTSNWLQGAHLYYQYPGVSSSDHDAQALGFPPDTDPDHLKLGLTDDGASAALGTAARNPYASAQVLNNAADRHAVIGLNWQNGDGAGRLIVSGTAPDPHDTMDDPLHPGQSVRNEAALAVMKDVGSDYQTLAAHANGTVKTALTAVAIDHLDSFATPSTGGGDTVTKLILPGGSSEQGVQLSDTTSGNFLKAIASFGPQRYGMLHAASLQQGAQWIHDAPPGSTDPSNTGAAYATNLDGRITGAGFAAAQETASHDAHADQKAYTAELVQQQNEATHDLLGKVAFQTVDAGLDIASFGATEHVAKAVEALSAMNGIVDNAHDDYQEYNSTDANSEYIQHLQTQVQTALNSPSDAANVQQSLAQDQRWMGIRAAALDPHSMIGNQHVDVSGLVDAHGNPYLPPGQLVPADGTPASGTVNLSDPNIAYATSNATYHQTIAPLTDAVFGKLPDGTLVSGINGTVGSHETDDVKWDQDTGTLYGPNDVYGWNLGRDPNAFEFETPYQYK